MGLSTHQGPVTCMQALMGFVVGVRVMIGMVVGPVLGARILVITKLILGCAATEIILALWGTIVLSVAPAAVELSIWIGLFGWG
jgi:hypothetical protein